MIQKDEWGHSVSSEYEIIKDAVHGYIKIFDHERVIIDSPIFQRLRRIKQNTGADYVYPCATHTRFSHCLGVMHISGFFTEKLLEQIGNVNDAVKARYYFLMRLWGLTHDIGQGPFSHLFDDVILSNFDTDHEKIGAEILRTYSAFPEDFEPARDVRINRDEVAQLLEVKTIEDWPLTESIGESDVNEKMLFYVGHGAYSADLMDYVLRDSYFTGAGYGNVDWQRLVYASIPHEDKVWLNTRGEEAFDSLLLARLFMFSTVYYHRTTRAATKVMDYFLRDAQSNLDFEDFINDFDGYAKLDEDYLLFHPELRDSHHRNCLLRRELPYARVREVSVGIDEVETSGFLEENVLTQGTRTRLPHNLRELPDEAFFVDTPKIPTNPVFGEDFVYLYDPGRSDPFYPRNIWKTSWGTLTREMSIIRLYIHDDYRNYESEIVNAFPLRGRVRRTFY